MAGFCVWLLAVRPKTLPAGVVPVAVGTGVAIREGGFAALPAGAALAGALLLQIGSNLANDYFDFVRGADTAERLGPTRVTQAGLVSAAGVRWGYRLVFGLALVVGAYLVAVGGWPIVAIGLAGIACAYAYTGGPVPLGYLGLGDPLVLAFFGPVAVMGTAYVQLERVPELAVWASLPVGLLATAILAVNNLRDIDTDRACGKRTIAVRLGRTLGRVYYGLLVAGAFAMVIPLARHLGSAGYWPLAALPLAAIPAWIVATSRAGPPLNRALAATAAVLVAYGALLVWAMVR